MLQIKDEVRDWLLTQQDWLQEAADRLLKNGVLVEADLNDVCANLKTQAGQVANRHRTFDNLGDAPTTSSELRLIGIGEVLGIESLAPRQPFTFGSGNLTVIYGHNGSGKSSYTRILKKASGKPRAASLKPNVFQTAPIQRKCQITYQLGGLSTTAEWHADASPIDAIRAVDIFDSDEASYYLSKESSATYTPPLVGMFEALAASCDQIKAMLQAEQDQLVSALPAIPPNLASTEPARRYGALKAETTEAAILQLVSWTEDDIRKLNELNQRLEVADPASLAKQKRATKVQVEQIVVSLQQAFQAYGAKGLQVVRELQAVAEAKRLIAVEAAQVGSAKLDGVGSNTWRALWEAARLYSQTAYPDLLFPVTDGARCILCHQDLAPDAQQRLRDFEAFAQGKLELDANSAEIAYQRALKSLPLVLSTEQLNTLCEAACLTDEAWKQELVAFWSTALKVQSGLLAGEKEGNVIPIQDVSENVARLRAYCDQLESQANQYDLDAQGFDRTQATNEKNALEAKRWISQQIEAVRREVERLKNVKAYDDWKALANSRRISLKAGEIAQKIITQAYVARFNRELILLGATRIKVEIVKTRTDRGKVLHQLRLKGAVNGQVMPESVLSEGERRIISLAAFLADVVDKPMAAPFIFDDPISSLDHDFEWSVASRLAELAKTRQVLVFTHRLSLYGAMEDAAKKISEDWKKQHLCQLCIESYAGDAGHPVHQATWNAKTDKANNILLDRLGAAKRAGDDGGGEVYRSLAQGICSDFRKLLERTVEDDLLNEVVKRHRRSVTTDNRLSALPHIETADCQFIDGLMTKYSRYEHSQSQEVPVIIPEEPELRSDIEALKQWRAAFIDRRKKAAV
ncbi:MAG TPA: AAA family ATPase [Fluviicoccus sp.]|nr:AAA family ATPase [Fluviicoccus sp.]